LGLENSLRRPFRHPSLQILALLKHHLTTEILITIYNKLLELVTVFLRHPLVFH
jgi:hypothetical protein